MAPWRRVDREALDAVIVALQDISWTWRGDEVPGVCGRLGWQLVHFDDRGGFADAGWDLGGDDVQIALRDGSVEDLTMWLTENVREPGPSRDQFLRDAFVDFLAVVTAAFDLPTGHDSSDPETVRWRMAESTILLRRSKTTVVVVWASNRFQDEWDALAETLA